MRGRITLAAATVGVLLTSIGSGRKAGALRLRVVGQPKTGERHAGEADTEFLQRLAPGEGLSQFFG